MNTCQLRKALGRVPQQPLKSQAAALGIRQPPTPIVLRERPPTVIADIPSPSSQGTRSFRALPRRGQADALVVIQLLLRGSLTLSVARRADESSRDRIVVEICAGAVGACLGGRLAAVAGVVVEIE